MSHFIEQQIGISLGVRQCQRLVPATELPFEEASTVDCQGRPRATTSPLKKIAEFAGSGNTDVWSLDEVHFQQHGSRCRMWIPPECKDPVVLHHPTRKSVGYFGAVRLGDGKLVYQRELSPILTLIRFGPS